MSLPDGQRIVSLLPSLTELLCELGLEGNLKGRSHECDYPASVQTLPSVTQPKYPHSDEMKSGEIQQSVMDLIRLGLSVYEVSSEKLKACNPDLVVTQDHCKVCAASIEDLMEAAREVLTDETEIISVSPINLQGIFNSFLRISKAAGVAEAGENLVGSIKKRFAELKKATAGLSAPTVVSLEWLDPMMTGGNWMPELIETAGGNNLLSEPGSHSPWVSWDKIRNADPDILLVVPCGFSIPKTLTEINLLTGQENWQDLKAVKQNRVFLLDGNHYFNRPGPRILDSAEILAEIFHPDLFEPVHKNRGWIQYNGGPGLR